MNMSRTNIPVDKNIPILVVDHLPMVRRMVKNCLRQLGFENIHEAEDSVEAIDKVESDNFRLIISDIDLPDAKPAQLVDSIRGSSAGAQVPVLFVASGTSRVDLSEDPRVGCIVKPFTAQQVEKKLSEIFSV